MDRKSAVVQGSTLRHQIIRGANDRYITIEVGTTLVPTVI